MEPKRPFSEDTWNSLPSEVQQYIEALERAVATLTEKTVLLSEKVSTLTKRVEELEARLNRNSGNSNKPPSSDPPYAKPVKQAQKAKRKRGARQGHKGHHRKFLPPSKVVEVVPLACRCGCTDFHGCRTIPFYIHQVIELPEIQVDVTHFVLHKLKCPRCGKIARATVPEEHRAGYGPRLSALVAELSGPNGDSRETVQHFMRSVFGLSISVGGIQRIIDRTSDAIAPIHAALTREARGSPINHVDETSWLTGFKLKWLWVMANRKVACFMIHKNRSEQAFQELIGDWAGILVSDNYRLYRNWAQLRQTCLAHYIRRAKGLAERNDPELSRFGRHLLGELSLLCHWAKTKPAVGEWRIFYARFIHLVFSNQDREDDAGKFARLLIAEIDSMWVFLEESGVEPTNNRAERALRFGVLWRKRSLGTQSEKGDRWVERILSLKQTCRMHGISTFQVLVDALSSFFKEQPPSLSWLPQT